jgi:hypothetical protein
MNLQVSILTVVMHENSLMFLRDKTTIPEYQLKSGIYTETEAGYLTQRLHVGEFGSRNPINNREVDTACALYRKGELLSQSRLEYIFGQSDGYHVMVDFKGAKPNNQHATSIQAEMFEAGDILVFLVQK